MEHAFDIETVTQKHQEHKRYFSATALRFGHAQVFFKERYVPTYMMSPDKVLRPRSTSPQPSSGRESPLPGTRPPRRRLEEGMYVCHSCKVLRSSLSNTFVQSHENKTKRFADMLRRSNEQSPILVLRAWNGLTTYHSLVAF